MRVFKPDKDVKLQRLLASLDTGMATKLAAAVERSRLSKAADLPIQSILDGLRPILREAKVPRISTPLRIFCRPFEDLLISTIPNSKQRGRISRASVRPVWNWLAEDLIPEPHQQLTEKIKRHILDDNEIAARDAAIELQSAAAEAIIGIIDGLDPQEKPYAQLVRKLGHEVILADAREMATILRAAGEFLAFGEHMPPRPIEDLTETFVNELKKIYDEFCASVPVGAEYAVAMLLGRLTHPWQILRLARAFSWKSDDSLISRTELAVVGDLLLDDIEMIAEMSKRETDTDQLLRHLREFVALFDGITNEIGIRKDGDWGRRLLLARATLSAVIEDRLRTTAKVINLALPKQRDGRGKPDPSKPLLDNDPDPNAVAQAYAMADFMRSLRPLGKQVAVTKPLTEAFAALETGIEIYSDRLTDALRQGSEAEINRGLAYLEITATILERASDAEAASIIRRRAAAAVG